MATFGVLADLPTYASVPGLVILFSALAFRGAPLWLWTLCIAAASWLFGAPLWVMIPVGIVLVVLNTPLRRILVSGPALKFVRANNLMPAISETERTAIEAGNVWVDKELFSGKPDFKRLNQESYPELTAEEQAFLDGPVEEVCRITKDWDVTQRRDLPPKTWEYLKEHKFFGMIIPKEYGGLGFSALAHGAVVKKLSSRSMPLAITVMVPNSLGPAELLLHCGTEEQRKDMLPKLAVGEEVPCFALTEPNAGSDAGSLTSHGEVFKGEDGELYLRLNWSKRYITLAAISTVLGLAFQLEDPDELLGRGKKLGITCALIPTSTSGVVLGRRHDPLGIPFYNCPTSGENVVVPISAIIGGVDGAGRGWGMLMECLAAGRGISLPGTSTGGAKLVARVAGAYAAVRKQFGLSIGKFEGIEEPLARIGGFTYMLDATRRYTCGALDSGNKPPVITAMAKLSFTEIYRQVINDGMDVLGGAAISMGPRNTLGNAYIGAPISITVEGANILTRTMIIFGQGAIRCHPYAYDEIEAVTNNDAKGFDKALFGHLGHVVRNQARAVILSLTRGRLVASPVDGPAAPYYRKLGWTSATFASLADMAMGTLGGDLKRKEKLTGRFADILCWMYLGTAVLRRFESEGRRREDAPFMHWAMQHAFAEIQEAIQGVYANMNVPVLGAILRGPIAWWGRLNPIGTRPSDRLGSHVARALQQPGETRDLLTTGIHMPAADSGEHMATLEKAFVLHHQAEGIAQKIKAAVKAKTLPKERPARLVSLALDAKVITSDEAKLLEEAEAARDAAIAVDSFDLKEYMQTALGSSSKANAQPV